MLITGLLVVGGVTVVTGINHWWHRNFVKTQLKAQTATLLAEMRAH